LPFVAFRNPNDEDLNFISQKDTDLHKFHSFESSGYVFAPFNKYEQAYIIKPDCVLKEKIEFQETQLTSKPNSENKTAETFHIDLVKKAISNIKSGTTSKIVISRQEEVLLSSFDMITVFKTMLNAYLNAYVYVWYHPKVGLWLGATPETLLKVNGLEFNTMSLAGTQVYNGTLEVEWGAKELEEQQMVSDFIKKNLENNVKQFKFSETETAKAGKLLHLRNKISGELNSKEDIGKLVHLLHPTPAVCGLPQEQSKIFIIENENYNRSFYTGYLGTLNIENQSSLYVNLRCFNIVDNKAYVYVGGGVTESSVPELEWKETVAKSQTIKSVLG